MVFAYYLTLALRKNRRSLLFCIAVAENYVYALLSFFTTPLIGGHVDYVSKFEGGWNFAEHGVLLHLTRGVHAFVDDVRLLSVLQGFQFDFEETYWLTIPVVKWTGWMRHVSGGSRIYD